MSIPFLYKNLREQGDNNGTVKRNPDSQQAGRIYIT